MVQREAGWVGIGQVGLDVPVGQDGVNQHVSDTGQTDKIIDDHTRGPRTPGNLLDVLLTPALDG